MVDPVSFGPIKPAQSRKETVAQQRAASSSGSDSVSAPTTTLPKLVSMAAELASQTPVDKAKIAQIRNAIDTGSYRVDSKLIADMMLSYYGGRL